MSSTIEKKSIYKLAKILTSLGEYHLEELEPVIEKVREQLRIKSEALGVSAMIGKYYKSSDCIFLVTGVSESGMIQVDSIKLGGSRKNIQYWVGSFDIKRSEWCLVGKKGTFPVQEIKEEEFQCLISEDNKYLTLEDIDTSKENR